MDEFDKALRYIFVLSFLLIVVAYWAGSQKILESSTTGLVSLGNAFTGRNSQGVFAAYPTGAPA